MPSPIDFTRLWLTGNRDRARREAREAKRALERLHDPTTRYERAIAAVWERALAGLDAPEASSTEEAAP